MRRKFFRPRRRGPAPIAEEVLELEAQLARVPAKSAKGFSPVNGGGKTSHGAAQ